MSNPEPHPFEPLAILRVLRRHRVDFVLIGGLAAIVHGSSYPSYDVDIVYSRESENLDRLAAALQELGATLRGAPTDLPFQLDARTIANGANFTFATESGSLDILAEPAGVGGYAELLAGATREEIDGESVMVASIDDLIAMKRAANRVKDQLMLSELIVLADIANEEKA